MGVTRDVLQPGNGSDKPQKADYVTMEYTGNLYDPGSKDPYKRGKQSVHSSAVNQCCHVLSGSPHGLRFDTSKGRGDFQTQIGVGRVIKGTTTAFCLKPEESTDT